MKAVKRFVFMIAIFVAFNTSVFTLLAMERPSVNKSSIPDKVIYLIRHAEKSKDQDRNPSLTAKGIRRAKNIAKMLKDKNITKIYSTNYARTMETAKPLSELLGVSVINYNPRSMEDFAKSRLSSSENSLIVGHSNTTPYMVSILGGESDSEIKESVYDKLYKLSFNAGSVSTKLLKSSSE